MSTTIQFDLKSAFSVKASWEPVAGTEEYTVQWRQGSVEKEATSPTPSIVLVNLEPDMLTTFASSHHRRALASLVTSRRGLWTIPTLKTYT